MGCNWLCKFCTVAQSVIKLTQTPHQGKLSPRRYCRTFLAPYGRRLRLPPISQTQRNTMEVIINDRHLRHFLRKAPRQIDFAIKMGLNRIALSVQRAEIRELKRVFTLRSTWWKPNRKYGIKIKSATKTKHESRVYSKATWLGDHTTGGTRYPQNHHRAVPISPLITRKKTGGIRRGWLPGNVKRAFYLNVGNGFGLVLRRKRKQKVPDKLYLLIPKARIKKEFHWEEIGERTALKVAQKHMGRAAQYAMKTAKH